MKSFLQKTAKTIVFAACLLALLYLFSCIFGFKYEDGITPMDHFYDLPEDTVDVLLLGSSHMGMNVDPSILWKENGIAAYNCWGSMQQVWNTYYYLKECLKYQNPKLVVMDVYGATFNYDYATYDNAVKNTQGLRMSLDKVAAIRTSVEDDYFAYLLLGFPTYHYRYSELSEADFHNFFWDEESGIQTINTVGEKVQAFSMPDLQVGNDTLPLHPKQEEYLIKIIDLCREENLPLLFVACPYYMDETEAKRFNEIEDIAQAHGVPFLNYSNDCDALGLDSHSDYRDLCHLLSTGIQKYTSFLGNYMKEHYDLPDRRKDENHIWNVSESVDEDLLYELDSKFYGGGHNYVDTGVQLCANPYGAYTLFVEIDTTCDSEDKVWLSCYSEEDGGQRGIMLRKAGDNLYFVFSATESIEISEYGDTIRLAVVKEGLHYQVYLDGVFFKDARINLPKSFEGNLLLGCQEDAEGKRFRYSETVIRDLQIYNGTLDEQTVMSWTGRNLPDPEQRQTPAADSKAAFEMTDAFVGNGYSRYIDSGISLYQKEEASWTLLTQFDAARSGDNCVLFSCFNEELGQYHGLLARVLDAGKLNLFIGNSSEVVDIDQNATVKLAVTKDESKYNVYINGVPVLTDVYSDCPPYTGNLLIGCQETPEGEKMRFSQAVVYNLEVYNGVMSTEEILAWAPEYKSEPAPPVPTPVDYTLEHSFLGNGTSSYVDTGVRLYDAADKSWTLEMKFRKNGAQTLATCFAEDSSCYRGLIISTLDDKTLNLTLGQTGLELELPPQPEQELKIVKEGYDYTVYLNGQYAGSVNSMAPEYDGTLYIGCAVDGQGNPFRFSTAKILEFTVSGQTD